MSTWLKLHRLPCNFTAVAAVIILFNMVQRQRWTGGALTARKSRFTWRKTTLHILHNSFRQSQTITLDSGLLFPQYPLPNVVLQVQKNIERKVDIIVATLKEGKLGRAFFWGCPETIGWDCRPTSGAKTTAINAATKYWQFTETYITKSLLKAAACSDCCYILVVALAKCQRA